MGLSTRPRLPLAPDSPNVEGCSIFLVASESGLAHGTTIAGRQASRLGLFAAQGVSLTSPEPLPMISIVSNSGSDSDGMKEGPHAPHLRELSERPRC
jgi:hypothetical protein